MKAILFCVCAMLTITAGAVDDSVKTVNVDPKVPMPEDVYLENPDYALGAPFGLLGATAVAIASDHDDFEALLKKNGANIDQLVLEKFSAELKKSKLFQQISAANPDATIHLNVEQYGMACPALSTDFRPILEVEAKLIKRDGTVLAEESAKVNGLDERMPAHDEEVYMREPSLFQSGYTKAAELVSAELIEKLQNSEDSQRNAAPPRDVQPQTKSKVVNAGKKGM